jgi:hypothetical protein
MRSFQRGILAAALTIAAALAAGAAPAQNSTAIATQAQLIERLQAQGYSDVKLSTSLPNTFDPHPELEPDGADPRTTAVHEGWNGTAVKGGDIVNVYIDAGQIEMR